MVILITSEQVIPELDGSDWVRTTWKRPGGLYDSITAFRLGHVYTKSIVMHGVAGIMFRYLEGKGHPISWL